MARIAHFREILKDDFFKKIKFFAEFLSRGIFWMRLPRRTTTGESASGRPFKPSGLFSSRSWTPTVPAERRWLKS